MITWYGEVNITNDISVLGTVVVLNCMVVGFITTCAISAYRCMLESGSWRGVFDTTLCDQVCQLVSSTNKANRHDITEILLKVALNTINLPHNSVTKYM